MPLPTLPSVDVHSELKPELQEVLARRMIKKRGRAIIEVLVCWKGASVKDDSWELLQDLQEQYPHLAGRCFGGGVLLWV